ncbi:MAG: DUF1905 domain-containing protein [bacterium]
MNNRFGKLVFKFEAEIWRYNGPAAWHFISLPTAMSKNISQLFADQRRGWGSLPVIVTSGLVTWNTSIFPDKKRDSYLLPVKKIILLELDLLPSDKATFELIINV